MPNLLIDITARFAQFQDSLEKINRQVTQTGTAMTTSFAGASRALASFGVGLSVVGLGLFAKASLNSVAALDDLAEKTSLTVETMASLREVAIIGGHALDDVALIASKFAKSVSGALGGNKELIKELKQLGITQEDLKSQNFDQIFVRFATEIANATDKTNALTLAGKLAGKSASQQLPFFNDLAERGLRAAKVTAEMAAEAEKVQKNFKELALRTNDARDAIVGRMLPALIALTEEFKKSVAEGDNLLIVLAKTFGTAIGGNDALQRDRQFSDNVNKKLRLERQIGDIEAGNDKSASARNPARLAALKTELDAINLRVMALQKEREEIEKKTTTEKPVGRTVGPVRDPESDAAFKKAAKEAEEIRKLYEEVRVIGASIDVSVPFINSKEQLEKIKKTLEEGKKGWIAYADSVFETAEAEDKAAASGESFTQFAEKIKDGVLESTDGTHKWVKELANLKLLLDTNNLSLKLFNAAVANSPLRKQFIDLIDPIQKYREQLIIIQKLEELGPERGGLSKAQATEAMFKVNEQIDAQMGLNEKLKETDDWAKQIGLTFASAFEDAVAGGKKFSDILKGLAQDIAKLILRKNVTEPLANAVGGFDWGKLLGGLLGAAAGGGSGGVGIPGKAGGGRVGMGQLVMVGESGPELWLPNSAGTIIPNDQLSPAGGFTLVQNNNFQVGLQAEVRAGIQQELPRIARVAEEAVRAERNRTGDQR